jgi:RNA polymerase sigma factor (TIGR02999 family)
MTAGSQPRAPREREAEAEAEAEAEQDRSLTGEDAAPGLDALLQGWRAEDAAATAALFHRVYPELRQLAARALARHQRGPTLDTGSLVNEACIRLLSAAHPPQSSLHLRAIAAAAMRQIVVDHARRHLAGKRGGGVAHLTLGALDQATAPGRRALEPSEVLELERALTQLATLGPRPVQVTECRFFAGMSEQETAEALGLSRSTVQREWRKAQAWLQVLRDGSAD